MPQLLTPPSRPSPSPPFAGAETVAVRLAAANWRANLPALSVAQPRLADEVRAVAVDVTPVFARDGSLTALDVGGRWWSGCSLPLRAARAVLKTLDVKGTVACFLDAPHAAYARVALDVAAAHQAVLLVVPDLRSARVMLQCEDFSADVAAGRLWFAWGDDWAAEMDRLFSDRPGLPTPTQFIRLPAADPDVIDPLIAASQKVFADVLGRRAIELRSIRQSWRPVARRATPLVCVAAGSRFRLWDDAGLVLAEQLVGGTSSAPPSVVDWLPLDPDDPAAASPLAFASTASACDAVVTANFSRGDAPDLLPDGLPWISWVTTPGRLPVSDKAGPHDGLLAADARLRDEALRLGWRADRVAVAGWPAIATDGTPPPGAGLAMVADTRPTEPPGRVEEYSSHRLLWETIRRELYNDPFAVGDDAAEYLARQVRQYHVPDEGLDRALFIDGLILPAYAQSVARVVLREGLPLRLFGNGWAEIGEFASRAEGPVAGRGALREVVTTSAALVHAWPFAQPHPAEAAGRPVVRSAGANRTSFLRDARRAMTGAGEAPASPGPLEALRLLRLIGGAA